jgi:hypothetical protein
MVAESAAVQVLLLGTFTHCCFTRLYPSDHFPLRCSKVLKQLRLSVAEMGDFEFDIELLIYLVDARPVLWIKTDGFYKDRIETKRVCRKVCICLQEDFEALGDV